MNITKQDDYQLLDRKHVEVDFPHDGKASPKNDDIKKTLAVAFKTKEELVLIRHIHTKNGAATSKITADIYTSLEAMNKFEKYRKPKKKADKK